MHIVYGQYPPKVCITTVSSFSLVLYLSLEKSKTMVMQNILRVEVNKAHFGLGENSECL